jgi:hypothetical protein
VICAHRLVAVAEHELDADLEAQVDHVLDHRLVGSRLGFCRISTSWGRTNSEPSRFTAPTKPMTNSSSRMLVELARRRRSARPALVHHHDLLGDLHRLLLVVRDEDRRHVDLVVEAAQPARELLADLRVERAERLVEEQHLGLDRERPGQRHALALAARELRRVAVGEPSRCTSASSSSTRWRSRLRRLRICSRTPTLSCTSCA